MNHQVCLSDEVLAHILCRTSRHLGRWTCSHGVREEGQGQDGHCHCQEHKEGEKVSRVVLGAAAWRSLESPGCWVGHLSHRGLRGSAVAVVHLLSISSSSLSDLIEELCLRVTVAACVWMALWAWGIGPKCGQLTKPSASQAAASFLFGTVL